MSRWVVNKGVMMRKYNIVNFNKSKIDPFKEQAPSPNSFSYGSDRDIEGTFRVLSNVLVYCRDYKLSKHRPRLSQEAIYIWLDMLDKLHRGPDNIQLLIDQKNNLKKKIKRLEKKLRSLK